MGSGGENQPHHKNNKKTPKDKKNPRPKKPNQPTQQLGAVFLEIALKYETVKTNLN